MNRQQLVESYRAERARWEQLADDVSLGYATERAEWIRDNPGPTFKQWLIWSRRAA